MDALNTTLKQQAVNLGLCAEWQGDWKDDKSQERLIEMFFKGIDFCLQHRYPSNDFIKKNFDIRILREHNVFVDDKRSTMNPFKCAVFGDSDIIVRYNSDYMGDIYVRDNSNVILTAKGRSFVVVHLLDKATITAGQFDKATIVLIKHSPDVTIFANDDIKVKAEYNYLS